MGKHSRLLLSLVFIGFIAQFISRHSAKANEGKRYEMQSRMEYLEERIEHLETNERLWRQNFKALNEVLLRLRRRFGVKSRLLATGTPSNQFKAQAQVSASSS